MRPTSTLAHSFLTISQILVAVFWWIFIRNSTMFHGYFLHGGHTILGILTFFFLNVQMRFKHMLPVIIFEHLYLIFVWNAFWIIKIIYPEIAVKIDRSNAYKYITNISEHLYLLWSIYPCSLLFWHVFKQGGGLKKTTKKNKKRPSYENYHKFYIKKHNLVFF